MLRGAILYLAIAGHPKYVRVAWFTALAGLCLQSSAAIVQHFTHVTRWYADLDRGWSGGWQPMMDPLSKKSTLIPPSRAQGLTSYINLTAAMLAAAIPFWGIPAVFGFTRKRWPRVLLAAGGVATAAALWYTDARGPMCAVGVVIIVFAFLLSGRWRISILAATLVFMTAIVTHSKYIAMLVFAAACGLLALRHWWRSRYLLPIILALGFAGSVQLVDAYILHYQLAWRVTDTGLTDPSRLVLYRAAVKTVIGSPWCGIGDTAIASRVIHLPGQLGLQHLPRTQQNFHDQYLQWAASEGLLGALACTLLVCWAVFWCWRLFRNSADPVVRSFGLAAASGLTIFLICNVVDAHFWRIEGGGFFWSLLAVTAATWRTKEGMRRVESA
jgi:O-antigen ligase